MSREARQRATFRPGARIGFIAASLAAAAALVLPTTAFASTEIGSAQGSVPCGNFGSDSVQASSGVNASYAVPADGISISSWSVLAGADTGPVALEVWRPGAPPAYTLVGISPLETLSANTLNTFTLAAPIGVHAGDRLGYRLEGPLATCQQLTQDPLDTIGFNFGPTPAAGATAVMAIYGGYELNIAATVEVGTPAPNPVPTSADQCKKGGWQKLTDSHGTLFKNQGDCVSFVATNGKNPAAGSTTPAAGSTTPAAGNTTPAAGPTTPPDSGTTLAAGTTTPADGATTPADTSTPPADTATPPADNSTTPADTATPPADTATPPADSSTTPADTATPPADSSTTPADTATPPAGG